MMKKVLIVAGACVLLSSPSVAQSGPVAQKSSDQIICELTGDCGGQSDVSASQDKGDSRGFAIARPSAATKPVSPTTSTARPAPAAPKPNIVRSSRPSATPAGVRTVQRVAAKPAAGRSELYVPFVTGSSTLTPQAMANVDQFAVVLTAPQLTSRRFMIEGHTDSVGGRAYNMELSQRRAQAVADYLVSKGASPSRFEVKGYGFDKPVNARNLKASANRRVEVVMVN